MKFLTLGVYIDGDLLAAVAVLFYWAWKPRTSAFYITAVVCTSFFIANFDSMLLREPMPLMVSSIPSRGLCSTGLGTPTSIISLTAASLAIYYDVEPDLVAWGQDKKYFYMAINIAYSLMYGV